MTRLPSPVLRAHSLSATLCAALMLAGCPKPPPVESTVTAAPEPTEAPALSAVRIDARRELSGLQAVACGAQGCLLADTEHIVPFDPATLEPAGDPQPHGMLDVTDAHFNGEIFVIDGRCEHGPCSASYRPDGTVQAQSSTVEETAELEPLPKPAPETPPAEEEAPSAEPDSPPAEPAPAPNPMLAERGQWADLMDAQRRLPFRRSVPVFGGGMVTYQRELGGGAGKLLRIGGGFRSIDAPGTRHTVSCEGWLATHPSGMEVYLLLWPDPVLRAYDTRGMSPRWSLELPGPAQGLFVDPAGRFALLSHSAAPDPDRLTDYPAPTLDARADAEQLAGSRVLPVEHPDALGVILVDVAAHRAAVQATGAYVAWLPTPDGAWLLATESEILRLVPR